MRVCDLTTSTGRLHRSMSELKDKWIEAKSHWDDATSREFAEKYLDPLPPQLTLTLSAIQRLAELIEQAERACEDAPEGTP